MKKDVYASVTKAKKKGVGVLLFCHPPFAACCPAPRLFLKNQHHRRGKAISPLCSSASTCSGRDLNRYLNRSTATTSYRCCGGSSLSPAAAAVVMFPSGGGGEGVLG
ncbi:hypothetical protein BDZ88DRAFT_408999 [Geranomyces variabilis]|nr:hypothetical protein BDZ88DRAFT_408999 [Geranomyces variabilis]